MLDWLGLEHVTVTGLGGFHHTYNESYADPLLFSLNPENCWNALNEELRGIFRELQANAASLRDIRMRTESFYD